MDRAALKWWLVLALCWPGGVSADVRVWVGDSFWGSTTSGYVAPGQAEAFCRSGLGARYGSFAVTQTPATPNPYLVQCIFDGGSMGFLANSYCATGTNQFGRSGCYVTQPGTACPSGSTAVASGVCDPSCPAFGSSSGTAGSQLTTRSDAYLLCIGGCQYTPTVSAHQADGAWAHWGPFTSMALRCTDSQGASGSPAPATCPAAQCMGEVNGTAVCVPCGEVKSPPLTSGTTAPPVDAGSAPAGASPGSTSTTEQTSCTGGQCTTTRTTVTVGATGGQTSQTSTTTQPIGTYCSVNPGAAVCAGLAEGQEEEPSTWGGSCAGFQCGGDAIQCAIAREQHVRNCALFDQQTDLSRAGYTAASGEDPADHPRKNVQTVAFGLSTMLDTTPLFGSSGGCPADFTFVYAGQSLTIPFSQACPVLHMLGAIWMGLCYLMAATIVFYRR